MRMVEEMQKQRVEAYCNDIEEVLKYRDLPSFGAIIGANHWLVDRCIELLFQKMDIHTTIDVLTTMKERHPKLFEGASLYWDELAKDVVRVYCKN